MTSQEASETPAPTSDLVRLTVNINHRSHAALIDAANRCGHTRTDTVCRALAVYDVVTAALADEHALGPELITLSDQDGAIGTLLVRRPRPQRWWWPW
jgi:hypothetical protein